MPELFSLTPPEEARRTLLEHCKREIDQETVPVDWALGRVIARRIVSPESLPAFKRSTMDGYAVRAADTFGAGESLPAYLTVVGEVKMGESPDLTLHAGEAAVVHTGGMLPYGADAVVMVELTQKATDDEIEVLKPVADGENTIRVGEDVGSGDVLFEPGHRLRPQDIGGLTALGFTKVGVAARPHVAILSTGDELVSPDVTPAPGQVRDVNSYTIAGLVQEAGGISVPYGIVPDRFDDLKHAAITALAEADVLVISAGSSVSFRDLTAKTIDALGEPGVLVHGVALKPGKPTILGLCGSVPVIGLPGNPVSAMIASRLFLVPLIEQLQGMRSPAFHTSLNARLTHNIPSSPGREDYVPVGIAWEDGEYRARPTFGKSNLIYTLIHSHGLVVVGRDANGLQAGEQVEVQLF